MDNDEYIALLKARNEAEAQLAYNRGRTDQIRDDLMNDSELVEVLRAQAWHRTGNVAVTVVDGKPVGHPEGWPEGVAPDLVIEQHVDSKMPVAPQPAEDGGEESKLIKQFRTQLGGSNDAD